MTNRLATATSPYLRQHADNPVDWWEWGPEAFEEAKQRELPILLSVGYAACHWCHVMAHESFENPQIAALMNDHFINVKVDREERPDVDAVYMQATVALTGSGGWPMTVVLDHEGRPFFAGTYFPDQPRHGQPSLPQILTAVSRAWNERRDEVDGAAASIASALRADLAGTPAGGELAGVAEGAVARLRQEYDETAGGFGRAPKFPPSMVLEFLRRTGEHEMVTGTMTAMARGGLFDQLGGGFARYAVDRDWVVPHFEKMLYDNALLVGLYARWGTRHGDRVARETADFLLRELLTDEGGFASSLDADSDGAEGTYYVWTPAEFGRLLGDDADWAADLLSVTPQGTFEHGSSTLQLRTDPDDEARWGSVKDRLLVARAQRTRPGRDDKVVAAWNGLAISGLVAAGRWLDEPSYVEAAERAAELIWTRHLVDGRLRRVSIKGAVGTPAGVLEDYGCVAAGLLDLASATGSASWLDRGRQLLAVAEAHFYAGDGQWYDTADDAEALVARPADASDNASPSGTSSVIGALVTLAALTGEAGPRHLAEISLQRISGLLQQVPRFAGWSLSALVGLDAPEIAIVGPAGSTRRDLERAALALPGATVLVVEESSEIPLGRGRVAVGGEPTAYVCRGHVCQRPVHTVDELRAAASA